MALNLLFMAGLKLVKNVSLGPFYHILPCWFRVPSFAWVTSMQFYLLLRKRASTHLRSHTSDHLPLVLQTRTYQRFRSQEARGFRFEEAGLLWEDCERRVDEA